MKFITKNKTAGNAFYCPMKCEGEKIYNSPGNCPVCNMKLVPVQDGNTHAHHHH